MGGEWIVRVEPWGMELCPPFKLLILWEFVIATGMD